MAWTLTRRLLLGAALTLLAGAAHAGLTVTNLSGFNVQQQGEVAPVEGIQFVGAQSTVGGFGSLTLDLTSLTGGIGTSAAANDIVILIHGAGGTTDQNMGALTSGYTELADLYAPDSNDANLGVSLKRMGGTPDTEVVTTSLSSHAAIAMVYRGVDTTTALDVTTTTATGTNSGIANPPAITPVTGGARVVAIGLNMSSSGATITAPSGYGNLTTDGGGTFGIFTYVNGADKDWAANEEDPGAFGGHNSSSITQSWAAVTLALRPKL